MELKLDISSQCIQCDYCRFVCPENAILTDGTTYIIEPWSCTQCANCVEICPTKAVKVYEIDLVD